MTTVPIAPPPHQDCSRCRHIFKCRNRKTASGKTLSDRNDTINLLVCRLKIGIARDASARTLLTLFRPGMVNLVASARRRAGGISIDFDDMLMEMQSFAIESILCKYSIGELNPITNFLFDPRSGNLVKWSMWYVTKLQRFASRHTLAGANGFESASEDDDNLSSEDDYGSESVSDSSSVTDAARSYVMESAVHEYTNLSTQRSLADEVLEVIDDGVTLNTNEYRVFKFCLQNANENNDIRMIDGLHIHLAKIMQVSRPRVTRLYKRSRDKVVNAMKVRGVSHG